MYMKPPLGFLHSTAKENVCKLRKSLYGLKQSPREWFERFSFVMLRRGYKQSQDDHTLFIKWDGSALTALIVYLNDIVITGNDSHEVERFKHYLS